MTYTVGEGQGKKKRLRSGRAHRAYRSVHLGGHSLNRMGAGVGVYGV